ERVKRSFLGRVIIRHKLKKMEQFLAAGLPHEMRPVLEYLVKGAVDRATELVVERAEERRARIAAKGSEQAFILYSPKPKSSGTNAGSAVRPQPGKEMAFTMEQV